MSISKLYMSWKLITTLVEQNTDAETILMTQVTGKQCWLWTPVEPHTTFDMTEGSFNLQIFTKKKEKKQYVNNNTL